MIACDGCGQLFGERDYQVVVGRVPGRFHSLDCAEKAWRRHVAEERLVRTYGNDEAVRILRTARGEPASEPDDVLPA